MKKAATGYLVTTLAIGITLIEGAVPLFAHHAFATEYNADKPVLLAGTVTKVEWVNPHVRFSINVTEGDGKVVSWDLELGSPNFLQREGWTRTSLKVGDQVVVSGYLAKDGSHLANAHDVRLADGRRVFAGSSPSRVPEP
jgi:hypothetical protein